MIDLRPWDDLTGMAVMRALDPNDFREAEVVRGATVTHLSLFADWRAMLGAQLYGFVAHDDKWMSARPFALGAIVNTGQAGVAQVALLARDHRLHRVSLARLCVTIRQQLPLFCRERGIFRVEARCWFDHPTASTLLEAMGFDHEADMYGFGRDGRAIFRQFARHFIPQAKG
jgi:hypothetical protein